MTNTLRRHLAVLPLSAICACAMSDNTTVAVSVQDSAGVQLVVNGGQPDSAYALTEPSLRIGTAMGEAAYEFHEIGPITVNGRDEILVADGGSLSVRVYDPAGRFVREFGRRGQGPGEFRSITGLLLTGDSVIVVDRRASRAVVFSLEGDYIDTWDLRLQDRGRMEPLAVVAGGLLAMVRAPSRHFSAEPMQIFQDTAELVVHDPALGTTGARLRHWAGERRIAATEVYPVSPLFEPKAVFAVRTDGVQYHAVPGRYMIDVYDVGGTQIRQIRRDIAPVPITADHVEKLIPATARSGGELRTAIERAAEYPLPPYFSLIGALLVASDGSILAQRLDNLDPIQLERGSAYGSRERSDAASSSATVRWDRFDADGRYIGAVAFPHRYFPRFYDGKSVLGVLEDDDGVQIVAQFGLDAR